MPRLRPWQAVHIDQQTHQLRDDDRRVRIVELDRTLVGQVAHLVVLSDMPVQHVLQRGRGEEILLTQPQLLARRRLVAGVQNLRNGICPCTRSQRADMIATVERFQLQRVRRPS